MLFSSKKYVAFTHGPCKTEQTLAGLTADFFFFFCIVHGLFSLSPSVHREFVFEGGQIEAFRLFSFYLVMCCLFCDSCALMQPWVFLSLVGYGPQKRAVISGWYENDKK